MRVIIALLALSVPVLATAAPIKGAGAGSCGEWVEERKTNTHFATLHWIQGFISSYNQYIYRGQNPNGVFGSADSNAIAVWMDNYCQQNPLSSPFEGTVRLIEELARRAN